MYLRILSLISLAVLFVLELALRYDTLERQIALSLTNVLGVLLFLLASRYLRRRSIYLPEWLWLLVVAGIWFDAAGNFAHLYAAITWWDKLVHVFGPAMIGGIMAYLFVGLRQRGYLTFSLGWHVVITISAGMFLTVLYELSEYVGDLLFATHRVTDLYDTADDLWWGLLSITVIVLVVSRHAFKKSLTDKSKMV